jgi:hypothetical protein
VRRRKKDKLEGGWGEKDFKYTYEDLQKLGFDKIEGPVWPMNENPPKPSSEPSKPPTATKDTKGTSSETKGT